VTRRCDEHVGHPYPPRCARCDVLAATPRIGYRPGTECALHANYPEPCARCERDAEQAGATP
jgi:hypothetical protein